jgi:hypothetical protein
MILPTMPILAEAATNKIEPLFGNQWLALLAILALVTVFIIGVAAVGRWLASTHPEEPAPAPVASASEPSSPIDAVPSIEIFAAIAAAVAVTLGSKARIAAINPLTASNEPQTDATRLQWSMEGRRQIYASHKVR